jgi:adenylyltransferase/sulfurtransferase
LLSDSELTRYQRQISLFGEGGQARLKAATVFVAGAGGLGTVISVYLAVAGVGRLKIVDRDVVSLSNLNRQILHWDGDLGRQKTASAGEKLRKMNGDITVEAVPATIDDSNIDGLVGDCELIIDAMDNFPTRYTLNRCALRKGIPLFHGAIHGFYGQATTIIPGRTACLRCLCSEAPPAVPPPVVGVAPGVIGCIQATEVLKYILGLGCLLENRLLMWDGLGGRMDEVPLVANPDCPDCGRKGE